MNVDNQVTIIEITADYLCLVVLGDKTTIEDLIEDIKLANPTDSTQYIAVKIDDPTANKCWELTKQICDSKITDANNTKTNMKTVFVDDGVETAQCYTYAEGYHSQSYMLMNVHEEDDKFILGYPKFELGDEEDPEIIVEGWFKKKVKRLPSGIKKNMKLITVVGSQSNILVIATKVKNKKKKNKA